MGKKKGGKEKVETATFNAAEELALYSSEVVWDLLVQASTELHEAKLNNEAVQYTSRSVVKELWECVHVCYFPHDAGESQERRYKLCLQDDEDLDPCPVDSWARSSIPSKSLEDDDPRRISFLSSISSNANTTKLPSEAGRSVARSVRSKATRLGTQRLNTSESHRSRASRVPRNKSSQTSAEKDAAEIAKCIVKLEELYGAEEDGEEKAAQQADVNQGDQSLPGNVNSLKNEDGGHLSASEEVRLQALRKLERREQAELERKEKMLQDIKDEEERIQKIATELKGKQYTFDHEVRTVDESEAFKTELGDKATPRTPGLNNRNKRAGMDSSRRTPREKTSKTPRKGKKNQDAHRIQVPKIQPYKTMASFQQQVLKNPTLEVQPGVVIREAGDMRAGPPRPEDSKKMSRSNFVNHQSMLESQSLVGAAATQPSASEGAPEHKIVSARTSGNDTERTTGTTGDVVLPRESGGWHGPSDPTAGVVDPNLELVSVPGWGQNTSDGKRDPAILPGDRTGNQNTRTANKVSTTVMRKPRQRPFVETKTSKDRKHLPAPLYPSTVGFGQMQSSPDVTSNPALAASLVPPIPLDRNSSPQHKGVAVMTGRSNRTNNTAVSYKRRGFTKPHRDKIEIKSDRADRLLGISIS